MPVLPVALAACGNGGGQSAATSVAGSGSPTSTTSEATLYELCATRGDLDRDAFLAAGKRSMPKERTGHVQGTVDTSGTAGATGSGTATPAPAGGVELEGDFDATDPANPKVSMSMDLGGSSMAVVLIDKTAYVKLGELTGGKYAKVDAKQIAAQGGVDFTDTTSPTAALEKQKDAILKVSCVGREDLDGRSTAHLRLTLDPAKLAMLGKPTASGTSTATPPASGSAGPARSGATPGAPGGGAGGKTVDSEHWIDDAGHTWKVTSQLPQGSSTFTYSKWGEPVTIATPPAAEVTQLPTPRPTSKR